MHCWLVSGGLLVLLFWVRPGSREEVILGSDTIVGKEAWSLSLRHEKNGNCERGVSSGSHGAGRKLPFP